MSNLIAVLTASDGVSDAVANAVREAVSGGAVKRLSNRAVECVAPGASVSMLEELRAKFPGFDINLVAAENRQKKLLIADMDSTIIPVECIDELADYAGVKAEVSAITERAMAGELDFEGALTARVALLKDMPVSVLQTCYDERIHLNPGAADMVAAMSSNGAFTALVSGGFTFFSQRVGAAAAFAFNTANVLLEDKGHLTGEVAQPILGRASKLDALNRFCARRDLRPADCLTVGDGANDLAMIEAAGLGVAFKAKPALKSAANAVLDHSDLTALLALQGISHS